MSKENDKATLTALAIYEIRVLLAGHLGTGLAQNAPVRAAAHLAYALHNQALAIIADEDFSVSSAIARIEHVESMLGSKYGTNFRSKLEK